MDQMNEILQHNVNIMMDISSSHMKVTNDIIDQIEAIKAQLRSPNTKDTIGYQQVDTKQVQIRSDPPSGSISGPKNDITIQSPKKIVINEGYSKSIRIQPDEEDEIPLSPKEDEYKMVTRMMYELKTTDSYFISPGDHIYPRIIMMKGSEPTMVKLMADYGYLDLIYPDKNFKELEMFDNIFKYEVSKYAQGRSIYLKFYTLSPEMDGGIFYPAEHIITIGYVGWNFAMDIGEINKPVPKFTRAWMKNRRVIGYKVLYNMAKNLYTKRF